MTKASDSKLELILEPLKKLRIYREKVISHDWFDPRLLTLLLGKSCWLLRVLKGDLKLSWCGWALFLCNARVLVYCVFEFNGPTDIEVAVKTWSAERYFCSALLELELFA